MRVTLDCFTHVETDRAQRIALRLRGLSYWASTNVGPYSHPVLIDEHTFISSQIGLIPANLSLPSPQVLVTETALVSQHAGVADTVRKSSGQWNGHAQLAISWLIDRGQVAGVAAACELLTTVSIILSISLGRFHLLLGMACTNDTVKNIFSAQECHDQSRSLSWSQRSGQASGRSVMVSHVNSGIAPTQDRDNPLCYKISMEGSGDTWAIVRLSGPDEFQTSRTPCGC